MEVRRVMRRVPEAKICAQCGRTFSWRRKWERIWEQVRYCSARCRSRKSAGLGSRLEAAILTLLAQRDPAATICPTEAARLVDADGWRQLLEPAREAARRLAHRGEIQILQRGAVQDPAQIRGPVRLRLPRS